MAKPSRSELLFESKRVFADGSILQMRIWRVPVSVPGSAHRLKYSLFYGRPAERIVLYDNERPKGDHRHYGAVEEPYAFVSVERLMQDFLADVVSARATKGSEP